MIDLWQEDLAAREAKGKAEGEARGEARGKAEGELKEARKAILILARSMKLEIADDFEDRLNAVDDLERLHTIMEQLPHVRSTEQLNLG